jgi:hypothetical protein
MLVMAGSYPFDNGEPMPPMGLMGGIGTGE